MPNLFENIKALRLTPAGKFVRVGSQTGVTYVSPVTGVNDAYVWNVVNTASGDVYLVKDGEYLGRAIIPAPWKPHQPRNQSLNTTRDIAQASVFTPKLDDHGSITLTTTYQGSQLRLTVDTRGYNLLLETAAGAYNEYPLLQHFAFDGSAIIADDRPYFWVGTASSTQNWQSFPYSAYTISSPNDIVNESSQLFRWDGHFIISKFSSFAVESQGANLPIICSNFSTTTNGNPAPSQQWMYTMNQFTNPASGLVIVRSPEALGRLTALTPPSGPGSQNSQWIVLPLRASPNIANNILDSINPYDLFTLVHSSGVAITASASTDAVSVTPTSSPPARSQLFAYRDGTIVSRLASSVLTVDPTTKMLTLRPRDDRLSGFNQWLINQDGDFLHRPTGLVVAINGAVLGALETWDPTFPSSQDWSITFPRVQPSSISAFSPSPAVELQITEIEINTSLSRLEIIDVVEATPAISASEPRLVGDGDGLVVTSLKITVKIGDGFFAGTNRTTTLNAWFLSGDPPSIDGLDHGYTWNVDLNVAAGTTLLDVSYITINIDQGSWYVPSNTVVVEYVELLINGTLRNRSPNSSNVTIDKTFSVIFTSSGWTNEDHKPVDFGGKTYGIRYIPYIMDVYRWMTYDPSTIDGVGLLLGMQNGSLVGYLLKSKLTQILAPNSPNNSFTWVYVPEDDCIIYKLWDHRENKATYTRHSQLAGGRRVVCAGEMLVKSQNYWENYVSDAILMINDASGHYAPNGAECLWYFGQKLQQLGIPTSHTEWSWRDRVADVSVVAEE